MKTTVELPDALMREVKVRAAQQNRKLKDVLAEAIGRGLAATGATRRHVLPDPVKLSGGPLATRDVRTAIASGRD